VRLIVDLALQTEGIDLSLPALRDLVEIDNSAMTFENTLRIEIIE